MYEAAAASLIAAVLWVLQDRLSPASVFGSYLALSGIARVLVEFVRVNNPVLLGLTEAQLLGLASVAIGTVLIVRYHKDGPVTVAEPAQLQLPDNCLKRGPSSQLTLSVDGRTRWWPLLGDGAWMLMENVWPPGSCLGGHIVHTR